MKSGLLAQLNPAATTDTVLYVNRANRKLLFNLSFVNTGGSVATIDIALLVTNAPYTTSDTTFKSFTLPADGKPVDWAGLVLGPEQAIRVKASTANVNFFLSGIESPVLEPNTVTIWE